MDVVVYVYVEETAIPALVKAITEPVMNGVEGFYAGDGDEPVDEGGGREGLVQGSEAFVEVGEVAIFRFPFVDACIVGLHGVEGGEGMKKCFCEDGVEEIINGDEPEGQGIVKGLSIGADVVVKEYAVAENSRIIHQQSFL